MTRSTDPTPLLLPEWDVSNWLNTPTPITLKSLRGRVVLLHAFQMLCPSCVAYGLPQAQRVWLGFHMMISPLSVCIQSSSTTTR